MRAFMLAATALLIIPGPALAQPATTDPTGRQTLPVDPLRGAPPPSASDGGTVTLSEARPIQDSEDPLNAFVQQDTVDGIVVTLTIDRDQVRLDSATPARIPRTAARTERDTGGGDAVTVTGFAGAQQIGRAVVPDSVVNAQEEGGIVRTERRQIVVPMAVNRPIDRIEVTAPATNARATIDVSAAWRPYCDEARRSPWCLTPR